MQRNYGRYVPYSRLRTDFLSRFCDTKSDFDIKYLINNRKQTFREHEDIRKFYDSIFSYCHTIAISLVTQKIAIKTQLLYFRKYIKLNILYTI